ncbi:competence protein ComK [Oceanobacillus manasiensis]|uniref:competence protein ComK n=1 Tax=Oceanobacillus manasiensis TaxID=586413 RepID=UPI0005AA4F90|nr:competence protein ComK [Oceanobacillus manasiensis]
MGDTITSVYIITPHTKAIISHESAYYKSLIYETGEERHSIHNPTQIIDNNCLIFGASREGRKKSVKDILGASSKLPLPVIPQVGVYMIPTASSKNKDCVWISYHQVASYEQQGDKTYITFLDGTGIHAATTKSSFDMQYKRTSQLIVHMNRSIIFGRAAFPTI